MARKPVNVSTLNKYIARVIQTDPVIGNISVIGEISNLKYHSSGHIYFSLKDEKSTVRCFMSVVHVSDLRYQLDDGMEVIAEGFVSVFERGGYYSLNVRNVEISGEGNLLAAFRKLYVSLEQEGLFRAEHKKKLPLFPEKVCVITSETGAAVRDILKIIKSRNRVVSVMIYPALVQGPGAAQDLTYALEDVNRNFADTDVIIIGRGGGSTEDLWAFNEETLARAIYASEIPVISAVGHEIDFTISDFAADVRAETPTAAAALAVPDISILCDDMEHNREVLSRGLKQIFEMKSNAVNRYDHVFFGARVRAAAEKREAALEKYSPAVFAGKISGMIENRSLKVKSALEKIHMSFSAYLERKSTAVENFSKMLDISDPEAVVRRGYAIVYDSETGSAVTSAADGRAGQRLDIKLKDGTIVSEVIDIKK